MPKNPSQKFDIEFIELSDLKKKKSLKLSPCPCGLDCCVPGGEYSCPCTPGPCPCA